MKSRLLIVLATAFIVGMLGCSRKAKTTAEAAKATPPQLTQADMEKAWTQAMTPSENHKILDNFVGKWKAESKFWMAPAAAPEVSQGKSEGRWVYDGRFVEERYKGTWNGKPFQGIGVWGYDNVAQRYQSSWYDSMSTQMMLSTGTYDANKNAIVLTGTGSCPMTGGIKTLKSVTTIFDKNRHTFEMFDTAPDGTEYKALEINYSRIPEKSTKPNKSSARKEGTATKSTS